MMEVYVNADTYRKWYMTMTECSWPTKKNALVGASKELAAALR